MSGTKSCRSCTKPMNLVYEVVERETQFVLWDCACGHKELERRPGKSPVPAPAPAASAPAAAADDDD